MRGLNISSKKPASNVWKYHQLKSIERAVNTLGGDPEAVDDLLIAPLFPGSYLCNQLVCLKPDSMAVRLEEFTAEVSVDIIYESLSCVRPAAFGPYILIDGDHLDEVTGALLFDAVCQNLDGIATLLVLDRCMLREIKKLFHAVALKVQGVNPEWSNAAQVLSFYRNAQHCIFIDNNRVVDAALSGCSVTLISSSKFAKQQSNTALWYCLDRCSDCVLVGALSAACGQSLVTIVENNLNDMKRVFEGAGSPEYQDWLDEYRSTTKRSPAVIGRYLSVWQGQIPNLLDLRLSIRRKALKLQEDPKRFCSDSRNPLLKQLGKLIPSREVAQ